jgi:hypothetical protein
MSEMVESAVDAMEGLKVTDDTLPQYPSSECGSSMIGSSVSKSSKTKIEIDASMYEAAMTVVTTLQEKVNSNYLFTCFNTNFYFISANCSRN